MSGGAYRLTREEIEQALASARALRARLQEQRALRQAERDAQYEKRALMCRLLGHRWARMVTVRGDLCLRCEAVRRSGPSESRTA